MQNKLFLSVRWLLKLQNHSSGDQYWILRRNNYLRRKVLAFEGLLLGLIFFFDPFSISDLQRSFMAGSALVV